MTQLAAITSGLLFCMSRAVLAGDSDDNIARAIVGPPVVSNGLIAGESTELTGVLVVEDVMPSLAMDPENKGFQIPAGGHMEVELGGSFERNGV